jgi:hypothetical protein
MRGCSAPPGGSPNKLRHNQEGVSPPERQDVTAAELCVTQEGPPSLVWRLSPLDHVLGDTGLRQFKPELEKFAVDAWRSLKRVLDAYSPDECAQPRLTVLLPPAKGTCACRKSNPNILVVQPAQDRAAKNGPG